VFAHGDFHCWQSAMTTDQRQQRKQIVSHDLFTSKWPH
jgi:hypothetical protein